MIWRTTTVGDLYAYAHGSRHRSEDGLINRDDQHIWRDAATISLQDAIEYFDAKSVAPPARRPTLGRDQARSLNALYREIDVFKATHAARIRGAYALIGPRLRDEADDLMAYWRPVQRLRYRLPDDLLALEDMAVQRALSDDSAIELDWPRYEPFSWEQ